MKINFLMFFVLLFTSSILLSQSCFAGSLVYTGENLLRPIEKESVRLMFENEGINLGLAEVEIFSEFTRVPSPNGPVVLMVTVNMIYQGESFVSRGAMGKDAAFEVIKRNINEVIKKANLQTDQ